MKPNYLTTSWLTPMKQLKIPKLKLSCMCNPTRLTLANPNITENQRLLLYRTQYS